MRRIGRALFLDLDGTLIVTKSGSTFPKDKYDWQFNGDILKRIEKYVDDDWYIMIVSNQGGIESGKVRLNDFREKLAKIRNEVIMATGCAFSRIGHRFCITNSKDDFYRKPAPGMGYDLAIAYDLDLSTCQMVGDASGKVRRTESTYRDDQSLSGWSYKDGQNISEEDVERITPIGLVTGTLDFKDFADSDLKFAKSCGMGYIDIDDFLKAEL